jgi:hypothetical protein
MGETKELKMTRKTGSAYRITCPNDYPIEHEIGPCTVVSVADTKVLVSFGASATGYEALHRYETAVAGIVRKKFDSALKPLLMPPPTVTGEPRASFSLLSDTLVFHESPENVRDIASVAPGETVRAIVQFIGVRRADCGWELDTAVTQIYIPPKKKAVEAVEAVEPERSEEAVEAERGEEDRGAERRSEDARDIEEMLTTEIEQDVESFWIV